MRRTAACLVAAFAFGVGTPAAADDHDPGRAGHPLRVLAYALHPVGVVLDWLVMRPAHWLGDHEPVQTLVGHTGERSDDDSDGE